MLPAQCSLLNPRTQPRITSFLTGVNACASGQSSGKLQFGDATGLSCLVVPVRRR
jgi:hypothetical protein